MSGNNFRIVLLFNVESQTSRGEPQDLIALQYTASTAESLYQALCSLGYETQKLPVRDSLVDLKNDLSQFSPGNTFIFNVCDGFNGENIEAIRVVQLLEDLGFKHSGSTAETIAICTDKGRAKERLIQYGVPTPAYQIFHQASGDLSLNFPVIVKPMTEDASLGIGIKSVTCNLDDLFDRVNYVIHTYHQPALVEEFIPGRELAVSMWGNEVVEVLPLYEDDYSRIEDPLQCLLTYEAKWLTTSYHYQNISVRCPTVVTEVSEKFIVRTALDAYRAAGLRDFGRVDIRFHNQIPYVIDVNEIPDLSPDAGFPQTTYVAGYTYPEMVEKILDLALKREGWR